MPNNTPEKIWLFRITHYKNLGHIIRNGIYSREHELYDPNYINIGDTGLIAERKVHPLPIEGAGNIGDYIPFYFGPLSPMLLNIISGYRGIKKVPQREIIYTCYPLEELTKACKFVFTDGHAKSSLTKFYTSLEDMDKLDWEVIGDKLWKNTDADRDRMRRKQAELLVSTHVPTACLKAIAVYDKEMAILVDQELKNAAVTGINVIVKPPFYY